MYIVRAAVMYTDGEILEGRDYGRITHLGNQLGRLGEKTFGFITSSGDFVLPDEASRIAVESGQINNAPDELEPEDLWPELAQL